MKKYYDTVIGLGQNCACSTALRRCGLQKTSNVFDWTGGAIPEKCGHGGLAIKVELICNGFKDFFNREDFESRGMNKENDKHNLWVVNNRTGLQYKHDWNAKDDFDEQFKAIRDKYMRRVNRLYEKVEQASKVLFVFIARDEGFDNEYLIEQQQKLSQRFPGKQIDMLFLMQDANCGVHDYSVTHPADNIMRIDFNFIHPTNPIYPESWNGNTDLYYSWLREMFGAADTFDADCKDVQIDQDDLISRIQTQNKDLLSCINSLDSKIAFLYQECAGLHNRVNRFIARQKKKSKNAWYKKLFSITKKSDRLYITILGVKTKVGK